MKSCFSNPPRRPKKNPILHLPVQGIALLWAGAALAVQTNVVILLADDLGWADVGYHGGPIETPSIDRLAAEGVQLDRFYSAPICSPTRAALMTGRDPLKLGIAYDQIHPWYNVGLSPDELTIADIFKLDGYQTGLVGKWHLGHSLGHQVPNAQGFEHFWGHLHTNTDYYSHEREGGHDLQKNGESIHEPDRYLTQLEGREAVRFIRERDPQRPFFLYVPFTAPHSPMQAPQATIEKYTSLPKANGRRTYAAMVDEMDQQIGLILDALDEQGIADDTIVLFFSDNGGSNIFGGMNTPLRGQKGETFEGGVRVPALIRWPAELQAGRVVDQMTTVMDVMPTLAKAARVRMPTTANLDGIDMWPAIHRDRPVPRTRPIGFVSEIPLPGIVQTAIYDGRWKLVQILREQQTEIVVREFLFDIAADPNEETDFSNRHGAVLKRMRRLMSQWRRQHPMAGTRGTLVAHPGWVAPKDWAAAVTPIRLLQPEWRNELPFSKEIFDATEHRGVLVDAKTKRKLIQRHEKKTREESIDR
ncbi:MAG: sulfatase-like hydrolase/transferase [bacterium]|nr:arylsulfatase [Deltaproteobacteria bacterium]MCP4906526.1 sulfatase-like hydrolase/transferase [bacterium]